MPAPRGSLRALATTSPEALIGQRVRDGWSAELSRHDANWLAQIEARMAKTRLMRTILIPKWSTFFLDCAERESWPLPFEGHSVRVIRAQAARDFWLRMHGIEDRRRARVNGPDMEDGS
jgi:hypothetical protein